MNGREPFPALVVRPVRPDDDVRMVRTSQRLSPETIYRRFLGPMRALPLSLLQRFASVDHDDREALVALDGDEIVAVVRWDRDADHHDEAEIAALVEDAWQHRGVGSALTRMLVEEAARHRIATLTATILTDNTPVRRMLTSSIGLPAEARLDGPQTRLAFPIVL